MTPIYTQLIEKVLKQLEEGILPCGQEYEISWTRFSLTKRCADCYYQSKYNVKKHRVREIGEMSNKRLAEILDPQAIWKRMVNRNPAERREELDEIALGRKV